MLNICCFYLLECNFLLLFFLNKIKMFAKHQLMRVIEPYQTNITVPSRVFYFNVFK